MDEEWKDVPGFEGYKCSTLGRVMSFRRNKNGHLCKLTPDIDGYLSVRLQTNNNKQSMLRVHRIIAITYLSNPNSYPIVNHKNGITDDNRVENLEWCTQSKNIKDSFTRPRIRDKKNKGEKFKFIKLKTLTHEDWRDILGHDGYKCNSKGDIISFRVSDSKCYPRKPTLSKSGYLRINLYNDNHIVSTSIHQLVAKTFIPNPNSYVFVNHKNGIKTDNRVENLEWCTASHNIKHNYDSLNAARAKGERNGQAKLTENDVELAITLLSQGVNCAEIGRRLNVHKGAILAIKNGKLWKHIERPKEEFETYSHRKLSDREVLEIYNLAWSGEFTLKEIADRYHIGIVTVSQIKNGHRHSKITGHTPKE